MSKKLFVGGLAWATTVETLNDAFKVFGKVIEAKIVTDKETKRSRGFGFVTFEKESEAAEAISQMDGKELDGRNIRVNASTNNDTERKKSPGNNRRSYGK